MSKGVHNIAFYVSPDPECSRTTQNSEISLAPSRGHILYAIYGNSTCVINHIVVTAIDKKYRNYYVSTICPSLTGLSWCIFGYNLKGYEESIPLIEDILFKLSMRTYCMPNSDRVTLGRIHPSIWRYV